MNRYNAYKSAYYDVLLPLLHHLDELASLDKRVFHDKLSDVLVQPADVIDLADDAWIKLAHIQYLVADFSRVYDAHARKRAVAAVCSLVEGK